MVIFTSIFVGDEGIALELEFRDYSEVDGIFVDNGALDVSAATEITFTFKKPDGTTVDKTLTAGGELTFTTDGTDGKVRYISEANFLDLNGKWHYQGFVEFASSKHSSLIVEFDVAATL